MSFFEDDRKIIEDSLAEEFSACGDEYTKIIEAMRYAIIGGKMIRGTIVLEFSKMLGTTPQEALPYAVAVECIQAYSLIHDDLPCMDNDDFRRGKPSCHKAFGEANALLAGDGLLTHAFSAISESTSAEKHPERAIKAVRILSKYAGYRGMVGGQVLDLIAAKKKVSEEDILIIHRLKTGALFKAAALIGCAAAGAEDELCVFTEKFAEAFGSAFQIVDDLLDFNDKSADAELNNYVNIFGEEKTRADIYKKISDAGSALYDFDRLGYDTGSFASLLGFLIERADKSVQ